MLSKVTRKLGLAIAQLFEQSRILDRDHRLVGEAGGELDLFVREGFDARADNDKYADQDVCSRSSGMPSNVRSPAIFCPSRSGIRDPAHVGDVDRAMLQQPPGR